MNYITRLATAMQQLEITPGTVSTVTVQHDAWCPVLRGRPECQCRPDIVIQLPTGTVAVLPDGTIRQPSTNN